MRVCGGIGSGVCFSLFMVSACYWRGRLCFGRGRDRGFVLVWDGHLESQKNPDRLKRSIHVDRIGV